MFTILNYVNICTSLWGYLHVNEVLILLARVSYPFEQEYQEFMKSHSTSTECWIWVNADPEEKTVYALCCWAISLALEVNIFNRQKTFWDSIQMLFEMKEKS